MGIRQKHKFNIAHMQSAYVYAKLSYCKRRQVGCVIVKHNNIIAIGYNGTSSGEINCCEDEYNKTLPHVIHAEDNALKKLILSNNTAFGSKIYVTISPCIACARRIVDAKVSAVYYGNQYNNLDGVDYLLSHGIDVIKLNPNIKVGYFNIIVDIIFMKIKKNLLIINRKAKYTGRKIW